ncbi:zinc fyve domain containing protein [Diaporthe amygdali]|uniref:zinc fyve domain containing protein n=1 Tax=Phomopsis amygdali TaxID=1214568 RepID=UPI0022FDC4C0|nr:zinc fyve domain containing protein [Diaporthe amygdali]KAJ0122423.1 zinc fyve domain containing protein [Diaporthe amygdali]
MAHSSDRSLLDRLNALKPTSVNLDRSTNALSIPATGIQSAEPLSREDALTERLRSLRNRRDHLAESGDPPPPYTATSATGEQPPPSTSARVTGIVSHGDAAGRKHSGGDEDAPDGGSQSSGEYDHYFDDVLQPLDLEDEEESGPEGDVSEDSKRVEDLLAKLRADPGAQPPLPAESKPDEPRAKDESDDDSEGEVMSREVENYIARTMDELKLDGPASQPAEPDATASPSGDREADHGAGGSKGDDHDPALPTVPQDAADTKEQDASPTPPQLGDDGNKGDGEAGLSLPTVPTKLVDPVPAPGAESTEDDPFESSIAARLAALKGAAAPIHTDAFGLPSAPTFQPEDNRPAPKYKAAVGRAGYTDADQKTWCIVCLEDGTIRCLGCDEGGGDIYCARCWREMHVGPSAGYDERGHQWEKFDPRRV